MCLLGRTFSNLSWKVFALGIFVLLALFPNKSYATSANEVPPSFFAARSFGASLSGDYFTTKANYETTRGAYTRLPGDSNLTQIESKLRGRYTINRKISLFVGTAFSSVQATDLVNTKTNSQLSEALAGVDYFFGNKSYQIIPEFIGCIPIDQTKSNQLTPMTNDGVSYIKTGLFAIKPFKSFRIVGFAGLRYPIDTLAKLFLYEATFDWRLFGPFTIGAGIDGYETVSSDGSTQIERQAAATRANASSERFYSYNPSLIEARGWIGFRMDDTFWIKAGYAKTVNGLHSAEGQTVLLSLVYNSASSATSNEQNRRGDRASDDALKKFEADLEDSDQSVFQTDDDAPKNSKRNNRPLDSTEKMLEEKSRPNDR